MPHSPPGPSARHLPWPLLILLGVCGPSGSVLASPWEPQAVRAQRAEAWVKGFEQSATRLPEVAQLTATLQLPDPFGRVDAPTKGAQLDLRVQWQPNLPPSRRRIATEHLRRLAARTLSPLAPGAPPRITLGAAPVASLHAPRNVAVGPFRVAPESALALRLTLFGLLGMSLLMSCLVLKRRPRPTTSRTPTAAAPQPEA